MIDKDKIITILYFLIIILDLVIFILEIINFKKLKVSHKKLNNYNKIKELKTKLNIDTCIELLSKSSQCYGTYTPIKHYIEILEFTIYNLDK